METKIPRNEELAQLVHPENQEDYTNEIARVLDYVRDVQAKNVKCLSVCIIESDPTAEDPSRVKAAHLVVGTKPQMAAMMASTYSAIGRTFQSEQEASEVKKEKLQ